MASVNGDHARAIRLLEEALVIAERAGNPVQLSSVRSALEDAKRKKASSEFNFKRTTPWTADAIIDALERRVHLQDLARAIFVDHPLNLSEQALRGTERPTDHPGVHLDLPGYRRVLVSPEGRQLSDSGSFSLIKLLFDEARPRSEATDALALEVIARRRAQVTPQTPPVDSPELRARYAAGDPAAAYELYRVLAEQSRGTGRWPDNEPKIEELTEKATAQGYAPAQWLRASLLINRDKDFAQAAALARLSAEAGDAEGAFELAKLFGSFNEQGLARNYAAAEFWFIEAGARHHRDPAAPGLRSAALELSNLYSGLIPNGTLATHMLVMDDPTYRWARELLGHGGLYAENARLLLDYLRYHTYGRGRLVDTEARLAAVPPEVAPFSAAQLRQLEAAAAQNSPEALMTLAAAYATGRGVHQDDIRAVGYYRQAAEAGAGLPAFRALAHHYARGHGVNANRAEHFAWLTRAAETGDAASWSEIGSLHHNYTGVDRAGVQSDFAAASAAYTRALALDHVSAAYALALYHRDGRGVPKDETRYRERLLQAANGDYVPAYSTLAQDLTKRNPPDHAGAIHWYRQALEAGDLSVRYPLAESMRVSGDREAFLDLYRDIARSDAPDLEVVGQLADLLTSEGNYTEAVEWHRKLALSTNNTHESRIRRSAQVWYEIETGLNAEPGTLPYLALRARSHTNPEAWFRYAIALAPTNPEEARRQMGYAVNNQHPGATTAYYGDLVRTDRAKAPAWLQRQVELGNPQAIYLSGMEQASTNRPAGIALIQRAAGLGNIDAKFRVGMMQFQGQGLPPDRPAGLALITAAADAGQPEAMMVLGTSLVRGEAGITADPERGITYLRRAAAQTDHPPVATQAADFVRQFGQHHAQQKFETLWANPETRFKELTALYTAAEDKTPIVEFFADKIVPAWQESTIPNAYKPLRELVSAHYAIINTMAEPENSQARWLLYRAVHRARLTAEKSGTKYPDFLYKWIPPGGKL